LLKLAKKLGQPHAAGIIIKYKISQEELSQIVGTTRPRISEFMNKFRKRGLININKERFIIVQEKDLANYLDKSFRHIFPVPAPPPTYL
jgi:CRP-like cAMP-binding protein